jgi:hypothetical protein
MINNIKIFDNLLNISAYNTISYILGDLKNVQYEQKTHDNELGIDYTVENIDINVSNKIEDEYIYNYANEFQEFFLSIRERNENEEILQEERENVNEHIVRYKDDLYNLRQNDIKKIKMYFIKNINYFKRFKGTKDYTIFIINLYLELKYKNQYEILNTSFSSSHKLKINSRYKIIKATNNYFGEGVKKGNIIIAKESLFVDENNNSVELITSTDSTLKKSGTTSYNKIYEIVTCEDDYFFDGCVSGNILVNNYSVCNRDNIVIEKPITIITKMKETVYSIQSVLPENVWELVIKPLVHPVGWLVYFINLNKINLETEFLMVKDIQLKDKIKMMNLGYIHNNPTINSKDKYGFDEINNLCLLDSMKYNNDIGYHRAILKFSLVKSNIEYNQTHVDLNIEIILTFSDEVKDTYMNDISLVKQGSPTTIDIFYVKDKNVILLKPKKELDYDSQYSILISRNLENKYNENFNTNLEIIFRT